MLRDPIPGSARGAGAHAGEGRTPGERGEKRDRPSEVGRPAGFALLPPGGTPCACASPSGRTQTPHGPPWMGGRARERGARVPAAAPRQDKSRRRGGGDGAQPLANARARPRASPSPRIAKDHVPLLLAATQGKNAPHGWKEGRGEKGETGETQKARVETLVRSHSHSSSGRTPRRARTRGPSLSLLTSHQSCLPHPASMFALGSKVGETKRELERQRLHRRIQHERRALSHAPPLLSSHLQMPSSACCTRPPGWAGLRTGAVAGAAAARPAAPALARASARPTRPRRPRCVEVKEGETRQSDARKDKRVSWRTRLWRSRRRARASRVHEDAANSRVSFFFFRSPFFFLNLCSSLSP